MDKPEDLEAAGRQFIKGHMDQFRQLDKFIGIPERSQRKPQPPDPPLSAKYSLLGHRSSSQINNLPGLSRDDVEGREYVGTPVPKWLPADWEANCYPLLDLKRVSFCSC